MKNYKLILFYAFILFAMGCGTVKKNLHTVTTSVSDTLVVKTEVIKAPSLNSTLIIKELCDSITSEPKPFSQSFTVGKDTVFLEIVDNELLLNIEVLEKELLRRDSVERTSSKTVVDVSKKVIHKIPFKFWIYLVISIAANILLGYLIIKKYNPFGLLK